VITFGRSTRRRTRGSRRRRTADDGVPRTRLRKTLAAYRLAFGQPRQDELIEFLEADRSDAELLHLASRLKVDLSLPDFDSRSP
jgi:hypothetical protein